MGRLDSYHPKQMLAHRFSPLEYMFHELMLANNFFTFKLSNSGTIASPQFLYSNVFLEEKLAHHFSFLCNVSMNYKHKLLFVRQPLVERMEENDQWCRKVLQRKAPLSDVRILPEGNFDKLLFVVLSGNVEEENEYLPYTIQEIMNIRYLDIGFPFPIHAFHFSHALKSISFLM